MEINGAIFDFDGTLANTVSASIEAIIRAVKHVTGQSHTHADIFARFGPTEEGIIRQLVPHDWQACTQQFAEEYRRLHQQDRLSVFSGLEDSLALLKDKGVRMAIVTGKGRTSTDISVKLFRIGQYFDLIETGSLEGSIKASCIKKVAATWDFAPDSILYLGDAPSDIRIARTAGVQPLAAAWDALAIPAELTAQSPEALFLTTSEFHAWLKSQL